MSDALAFGSAAWAAALRDELNASSEYRNAAATWGVGWNGNLLFVFEADAALPSPVRVYLELAAGRCARAEIVAGRAPSDAGFVLRAPFSLWREILERRTLAATAILTGKMKVEGNKLTLLKHAGANRALIHVTATVPTEFPSQA